MLGIEPSNPDFDLRLLWWDIRLSLLTSLLSEDFLHFHVVLVMLGACVSSLKIWMKPEASCLSLNTERLQILPLPSTLTFPRWCSSSLQKQALHALWKLPSMTFAWIDFSLRCCSPWKPSDMALSGPAHRKWPQYCPVAMVFTKLSSNYSCQWQAQQGGSSSPSLSWRLLYLLQSLRLGTSIFSNIRKGSKQMYPRWVSSPDHRL